MMISDEPLVRCRGDHGLAGGECLKRDETEGFVPRGQSEDIDAFEKGCCVLDPTAPGDLAV